MRGCKKIEKYAHDKSGRPQKFLILLILGFFIISLGIIILMIATILYGDGSANFGGVIFIWFIPIVFGAGPEATWMIIFAIIFAVLSIIIFLILRRELAKTNV